MSNFSPFDFIKNMTFEKKNLMRSDDVMQDAYYQKEYNPWIINIGLSYFADTILYANEVNRLSGLNDRSQYEYLLHGIRKKKRFTKWNKQGSDDTLNMISEYYSCNRNVAKEYLKLLTKEQIDEIKTRLDKGGKSK